MSKEVLAIPKENLAEAIGVIRAGLLTTKVSDEFKNNLLDWCQEIEEYLRWGRLDVADKIQWTPEYRLKVIHAVAAKNYKSDRPEGSESMLQRIMFLCSMTDEFLNKTVDQYTEEIEMTKSHYKVQL